MRICTVIAMSIHSDDESPIFGEHSTQVTIDDEGAGPYIVLTQTNEGAKVGTVAMDMEDLELVIKAARDLMAAQPKEEKCNEPKT